MTDHSQPVTEKPSVTAIERLIEAVTYFQTVPRGIYYDPAKAELKAAYAAVENQLDALHMFVKQWDACGPNSEFGRYFDNVRKAATSAITGVL